jgi:hypothetical protein
MSKKLLQDMVRVKPSMPVRIFVKEKEKERIPDRIKVNDKRPKYRIYFVALVSFVFLLFALSFLFSNAKVIVTPKVEKIPLNDSLSATKDSSTSGLSFDLVVISGEDTNVIQTTNTSTATTVAQGVIAIYNSFSSSPQVLAINTRLEGSNGKTYKTDKQITIPGIQENGDPGVIQVGIYAAGTGQAYDSSPIDFKIIGFNSTAKYTKIYGRSVGNITSNSVISSLDKTNAVSALEATLEADLLEKATDQIPQGFVLFKDATFLNVDNDNITFTPTQNNMVSVDIKGTLYGLIFNQADLTNKIAQDIIPKYDGSEVYIPNIKDLTFSLSNKDSVSFADVENINFTLSGTPQIIWKVDETKLISDMLDKKKTDFNQILSQYPSIDTAQLTLRPFWKTSFPSESKNIQVIINYPQ